MPRRRKVEAKPTVVAELSCLSAIAGLIFALAGFLMLTSTPQLAYQWTQREGYIRSEVDLLSRSRGHVTVRIAGTGEELTVNSSAFDTSDSGRIPVWYNPRAKLVLGITIFDERIVSGKRHPELPPGSTVLTILLVNAALFAVAALILWPRESGRTSRGKEL